MPSLLKVLRRSTHVCVHASVQRKTRNALRLKVYMAGCKALRRYLTRALTLLTGLSFLVVVTTLLAFGGGRPDQYWPFVFPAFVLGSAGAMLTYTHTNIAILQVAPASIAGTVGANFNGALELGSAVGFSAVGSIETSVEATHGGPKEYHGRAAAFLFLLGLVSLEIISVSSLYQTKTDHLPQPKSDNPVYDNTAVQQSKEQTDEMNDVNHGANMNNSPM
ncbi:hypothetical protein PAXINDRAFT_16815 [Paxillus involutus ATCC 200175]|uniref:Uncharacterized protein n=1 Tax=Paxillus involutus ATCC 200175 TaxID=664439 RepID=A0A0C9TSN6_PAXIN|nr:hypothetical protein PAXINDRAFT_16815 [Paxillus involutus ATCC 200175]